MGKIGLSLLTAALMVRGCGERWDSGLEIRIQVEG